VRNPETSGWSRPTADVLGRAGDKYSSSYTNHDGCRDKSLPEEIGMSFGVAVFPDFLKAG